MNSIEIQKKIDEYRYEDARAKRLKCNYFGDEVILVYENSKEFDTCLSFKECFRVLFNHDLGSFGKWCSVKEMTYAQVPYFVYDIEITEIVLENEEYFNCKVDFDLLELEILCKKIDVDLIPFLELDNKVCSEL